jgi:hypothetical protein
VEVKKHFVMEAGPPSLALFEVAQQWKKWAKASANPKKPRERG